VTKVVCWNINKSGENSKPPWHCWRELLAMNADIALLQEVGSIPTDLPQGVEIGDGKLSDPWCLNDYDRWPLVVKLSDSVKVQWFKRVIPYSSTAADEMAVSGIGTVAAARVIPLDGEPFVAVSMYARWFKPHDSTNTKWYVGYSDASAHRIISDLSTFIGSLEPRTHRILAAGDLNTIYESTDKTLVLPERDRTVFDRMDAIGLEFIGPQHPEGRQADPIPYGLPEDTKNVPTYYTNYEKTPEKAQNQLDYVFASRGFHHSVRTRALNDPDEWGSSDHCRILIEVG